jgi:hypothetical protein
MNRQTLEETQLAFWTEKLIILADPSSLMLFHCSLSTAQNIYRQMGEFLWVINSMNWPWHLLISNPAVA